MRFENIFDMTQKKRGIALFLAAALVVCGGTAFVGCAESETTEKALSGTVYGDYTEETVHELYGQSCNISAITSVLEKFWGYCHCQKG